MTNPTPTKSADAHKASVFMPIECGQKAFSDKQYNHSHLPKTHDLAQLLEDKGGPALTLYAVRNSLRFLPFIMHSALSKAPELNQTLSDDVLSYIAKVVQDNVLFSAALRFTLMDAPSPFNFSVFKGADVFDAGRFDHPCAYVTSRAVRVLTGVESACKDAASYAMFIGKSDDITVWPDSVLRAATAAAETGTKAVKAVYNQQVEKATGDAAAMRSQLSFLMLHDFTLLAQIRAINEQEQGANKAQLTRIFELPLWGNEPRFIQRIEPLQQALLTLLQSHNLQFMADDLQTLWQGEPLLADRIEQYNHFNTGLMRVFV